MTLPLSHWVTFLHSADREGKPVAQNKSETLVMPTELSTTHKTNEKVQRNLLRDFERKFAYLPNLFQRIKLCSNASIVKTVTTRTVFHDPRRCGTLQIGWLMSRKNSSSKRPIIQSERMDSWEHEGRCSFGGGSQSPPRTLRNRDHDQLK